MGLDLFFTNETNLITDVDINKSSKSDHSKIELNTKYIINNEKINNKANEQENINDVNFHDKTKWEMIKDTTNSKIEDNRNGRRPKWKKTEMEDDRNRRQPKWKTTKMEDDRNGRRPEWKTTKTEDNKNGPM